MQSTTESTSPTTGALTVAGGAGIGSDLYVGGDGVVEETLQVQSTTESTSPTTGALTVAGGAGIGSDLYVGGDGVVEETLQVQSTTDSNDCDQGALVVAGGVGIGKKLTVCGDATLKQDVYVDGKVYQDSSLLMPIGAVMPFAAAAAPGGYLLCNGSAVSRTLYADLFAVIGTTYGVGDGSTTFNLPDLRGRMILGVSGSHALASTAGSETVSIGVANLPPHTHTGTTAANGAHTHSISDPGHQHGRLNAIDDNNGSNNVGQAPVGDANTNYVVGHPTEFATTGISVNSAGQHSHSFTTDATGSGVALNILPPFMSLNFIIKY